jgi:protein O-GlcNAc transferase
MDGALGSPTDGDVEAHVPTPSAPVDAKLSPHADHLHNLPDFGRELARRGDFRVEVYASPRAEDIGPDGHGVWWYRLSAYDVTRPADVFVAWRYHVSVALGGGSRRRFVWLQDLPSFETYTPGFLRESVDGVFVLSAFHASLLPPHARALAHVTPNGLDPSYLCEGSSDPLRFVYGSAPNRGLEVVLRAWGEVRARLVEATGGEGRPELLVYYGFTEAFVKYGRRTMPAFEAWLDEMQRLLEQPGVVYHGACAYCGYGFIT